MKLRTEVQGTFPVRLICRDVRGALLLQHLFVCVCLCACVFYFLNFRDESELDSQVIVR
jgi:hypothetical protein